MKAGEEAGALVEEDAPAANVGVPEDGADEPAPEPAPGESDGDEAGPARRAGAPVWLAAVTVLVALLIAGIVTTAVNLSGVHASNARASSRAAAISVARTAVTDLTTANYQDPQQYVQRLKPLAVGTFLSQFTNSASGFQDLLTQGKVQTTGRVVDVGVQRMGSGTAQLNVLVYETVKNSQTPKGSQRAYRMTVSMIQSGSQWLVSNVESVA